MSQYDQTDYTTLVGLILCLALIVWIVTYEG